MSRRLAFTPAASADIARAYDWYEAQRAGLGEEFLAELHIAFTLRTEFSDAGPAVHHDRRRMLLRRFPWAVYYRAAGRPRSRLGRGRERRRAFVTGTAYDLRLVAECDRARQHRKHAGPRHEHHGVSTDAGCRCSSQRSIPSSCMWR